MSSPTVRPMNWPSGSCSTVPTWPASSRVLLWGAYAPSAVGVAVGIYFALQPYVGTEEIGWMCILGAAPFAACGFFTYHGMTAEQVLWAWFKSEILCPKRLEFKSDSYYYEAMQPAIRAGMKRKRGKPMKKNTHDSEETA